MHCTKFQKACCALWVWRASSADGVSFQHDALLSRLHLRALFHAFLSKCTSTGCVFGCLRVRLRVWLFAQDCCVFGSV
eukprot:1106271-Pleurochrysis_carterae.AAC.4